MIGVLALSPAIDITYDIDALRPGEINRPRAITRVAGGKALNAARVAHALGAEVRVIAALGGSNGQRIRRWLEGDGVETTVVELAAETRVCLALVEEAGGATSTDVYEPAAPLEPAEWLRYADAVRSAPPVHWLAVSGSLPDGVPLDAQAELLADVRARGTLVALDGSGAALAALAAHSDLVKVNRHEVAELVGRRLSDAGAASALLHDRFGVDAVVTDGVRGGAAIHRGETHRLAPPRTVGRYPAGSGDAFFGGLLSALDGGRPFEAALDIARDAAERNAQVPGQGVLAR